MMCLVPVLYHTNFYEALNFMIWHTNEKKKTVRVRVEKNKCVLNPFTFILLKFILK